MKRAASFWLLGTLVLLGVSSWLVTVWDTAAHAQAQDRALAVFVQEVEDRFFRSHRAQLSWLAQQEPVLARLEPGAGPDPALDRLLVQISGLLDLEAVYLVSAEGVIVAASDRSYVGIPVNNRDYFRQAAQGTPAYSLAERLVHPTRGLYAVVPVISRGQFFGAVCFRTAATQLDNHLSSYPGVFLLDPAGRIFGPSGRIPAPDHWRWSGTGRVLVGSVWHRVSRKALSVDPRFTFLSLQPETLPWKSWLAVDLVLLLTAALVALVWQQSRLLQERRRAEKERQQREGLLANLLEGIAVLDPKGLVTWTNPAFARLAQLEEPGAEIRLADLWDRPGVGPWREVLEGRRTWVVFESVLRGRRGGWTPVLAGLTAADGRLLLSVLDRTERYRSDQLLRHSQKLTVLGQLAGGVAHDLNNMLGVLTGMADLIRLSLPERDPLQESVDLMLVTLARAAGLADKMLNFARETPIERVPLDMTSLLRELQFLARTALPEGVKTVVEAGPGPVVVSGDENLLLSALLNLVLNAAEAMPGGGVIRVTGKQAAGLYEIEVEDEGTGMDPATLSRVFEPYFTTKGPRQGTGLGLGLVRRTILDHQGTIHVRSEPGQGTCVRIQLPVDRAVSGSPTPE